LVESLSINKASQFHFFACSTTSLTIGYPQHLPEKSTYLQHDIGVFNNYISDNQLKECQKNYAFDF